jgi:hypothetical protein
VSVAGLGAGWHAGRCATRLLVAGAPVVMPLPSHLTGSSAGRARPAGQVDSGGQQVEVSGGLDEAADPHPSAAVAAADQMGQLALHLGWVPR